MVSVAGAGAGRSPGWRAPLGAGGLLLEAVALKSTLALRGLAAAGRDVAGALQRGDLAAARTSVGRHLVSRPTATLRVEQVAAGAIESVAENLTDSFVAPLLFYLVFGLPGAFAYRALNTADSMLGYREGALEYFGKLAARLDDVANLVPARLSALALVVAAGRRAPEACAVMLARSSAHVQPERRVDDGGDGRRARRHPGQAGRLQPGARSRARHRRYLPRAHPDVAGVGDRPGGANNDRSIRYVGLH